MPNSLIFVVILAVWAAYLIQHWIRRRDHVATARSVDRFSEAMRVLERRQSMPRADISTPKQRSYSVSLTRPAHPDVVVKRAGIGAPATRRRSATKVLRQRPSAATLRAAALIAGMVALVSGITVSVVGLMSWWGALGGAAALLLAITFVRFSVETTRRRSTSPVRSEVRRAAASGTRPRTARPAVRRPATTRPAADRADRQADRRPAPRRRPSAGAAPASQRSVGAAVPVTADTTDSPAEARTTSPVEARTTGAPAAAGSTASPVTADAPERRTRARATELYDLEALEPPTRTPADDPATVRPSALSPAPAPAADPEPGTWDPVPVPPPTYTLKARAPRREEPRGARSHRTVEDLPFDGHALALEEEFEDLPPVHSVG